MYLEGNAEPNFIIQIRFQKQGAKPLTFTAKSDSRGEWVLAEKVPLEAGDWEVRARTVDAENKDNISEWSNPRVFKVIISGITIGGINIKFAALFLIIVVLLSRGFVELRQGLIDELQILESHKNLSQEELVRKEQLLRNLENLERNMQREIKDIEERL